MPQTTTKKTFASLTMNPAKTPELWAKFQAISIEISRGPADGQLIGMVRELYQLLTDTYTAQYGNSAITSNQIRHKRQPGWYLIDISALRKKLCSQETDKGRAVATYFQEVLDTVV